VSRRLTLDVTDPESIRTALDQAGELDAIVNNAAISGKGPLEDFPLDRFQMMLETNTLGPLRVVQAVIPAWRRRVHGVVVNVSSIQGRVSTPLEARTPPASTPSSRCRKPCTTRSGISGSGWSSSSPATSAPG
jgi:NAD(P)-dependent dehydrogenase (short-subunit alcohol dehydrogenase family)